MRYLILWFLVYIMCFLSLQKLCGHSTNQEKVRFVSIRLPDIGSYWKLLEVCSCPADKKFVQMSSCFIFLSAAVKFSYAKVSDHGHSKVFESSHSQLLPNSVEIDFWIHISHILVFIIPACTKNTFLLPVCCLPFYSVDICSPKRALLGPLLVKSAWF